MPIFSVFSFVAGILALQQFSQLPKPLWSGAALLAWGVLWHYRFKTAGYFCLGFAWALLAAHHRVDAILPQALEGQDLVVEGRVLGLPVPFEHSQRFEFQIQRFVSLKGERAPAKVRLSWYDSAQPLRAGQRWRLTVRLKRPHGQFNPGGFDYERWLFMQGFKATGYVRKASANRLLAEPANPFSLSSWRQALDEELSRVLGDSELRGLIKALTLGARHEITPQQWEVFRRTGTSHLVAISGLHIGLIATLSFFLARWLCASSGLQRYSPPRAAAIIGFLAALLYAALADFAIPTQRALIMVAVFMGGIFWQRRLQPFRVLATAMALVVGYDPFAVLAPGFWLSFLAVALILYAFAGRLGTLGSWFHWQRVHWVTALGLAPLLLLYFQQVSMIAPVANLIAVPVVSLIVVPASLLGTFLLAALPTLAGWALGLAEWVLRGVWVLLSGLSKLSFAQWTHPQPPLWSLPFALLGILLLWAPRGVPARWLSGVLLLPMIFVQIPRPAPGAIRLTLLDVGQGLAAVVQTANHALVYDTGARYSERFDMGSSVVAPFLRAQGLQRIDRLILSHGDNDHMGGASALAQAFPIGKTLSSVPEQIAWSHAAACQRGQKWRWDGVEFAMLAPLAERLPKENNNSCVLKIVASAGSVLLPGDIEAAAEKRLVGQYREGLASDVIVVPHHGSKSSSTRPFLQAVKPRYALVPAGYRNKFGFPHGAVVERYEALGAELANTAQAGAILVTFQGKEIRLDAYRKTHGRYWNRLSVEDFEIRP